MRRAAPCRRPVRRAGHEGLDRSPSQPASPSSPAPPAAVFLAPIRHDVVTFVHTNMRKNQRQAYAVAYASGEQTSAMSWGTGRAVARIPRVGGGGSGRSGQGAFGNMCRKGRMFAPTKIWRRWHRKVNVAQRRYAVASALAASAVPALVMARGHKIDAVPEIPLVVRGAKGLTKTKDAVKLLEGVGAMPDVARVVDSKKLRAGRGKMRNRRYVQRRGPLVIYADEDDETARAFRNIAGVDLVHSEWREGAPRRHCPAFCGRPRARPPRAAPYRARLTRAQRTPPLRLRLRLRLRPPVDRLNLLQLAPGGHMGRFCVWTEKAFARLDDLFGAGVGEAAKLKTGFTLARAPMLNADLARLINSTDVQAVLRPAVRDRRLSRQKKNPLRNRAAMFKLNPYAKVVRESEMKAEAARATARAAAAKAKRGLPVSAAAKASSTRFSKQRKIASRKYIASVRSDVFVKPADVKFGPAK